MHIYFIQFTKFNLIVPPYLSKLKRNKLYSPGDDIDDEYYDGDSDDDDDDGDDDTDGKVKRYEQEKVIEDEHTLLYFTPFDSSH